MHRTRTITRLLVAVLIVCGCVGLTWAQHVHHAKRLAKEQIEDLEHQWQQATLTGDAVAMDRLLSDDYLGITMNGELVTKTQELDRLKTRALNLKSLNIDDLKIKVVGQVAIVTSLATVQGISGSHPVNGSFRYTRIYQWVGASKGKKKIGTGQWKITSFEVTRIPRSGMPGMPPADRQ